MEALSLNIAFCTGALGLFIAGPLMVLSRQRPASLWLGLYLMMISLACLGDYVCHFHRGVGLWFWWVQTCLGPFYYCYVRSMVGLGNGWRQAWHFVPLAVYVCLASAGLMLGPVGAVVLDGLNSLGYPQMVLYQGLSLIYVVIGPYRLYRYGRHLRAHYSSTKDRDLGWLTKLSGALMLLWLDWVLSTLLRGAWLPWFALARLAAFYFVGWYGLRQAAVFMPVIAPEGREVTPPAPAPALSSAQVLSLPVPQRRERTAAAVKASAAPAHPAAPAMQPAVPATQPVGTAMQPVLRSMESAVPIAAAPSEPAPSEPAPSEPAPACDADPASAPASASMPQQAATAVATAAIVPVAIDGGPPAQTEAEKYARSGMTDAARRLIGERLARRMTMQRDYLESDLRLTELAERVGTTPQLLSQYINRVLGLNFFDYINGLRIAEVQRMMLDPAHAASNLLDLAHAAGFNSKSTFNAYFKNISGMAPSSWRSQYSSMAQAS